MADLAGLVADARAHLNKWPYYYVMLRGFLPLVSRPPLSDRVTTTPAGSRTPENPHAQAVMDLLAITATTWAAYAAGMVHEPLPVAARHGREGARFDQCVQYLTIHGDRLLSSSLADEYMEALIYGSLAARKPLHEDAVVHRLPAPCPDCNAVALIRHNGHDEVICGRCRSQWTTTQYELLCRVLAAEVRQRAAS